MIWGGNKIFCLLPKSFVVLIHVSQTPQYEKLQHTYTLPNTQVLPKLAM